MVIGENPRGDDMAVNVCKKKQLTNMRASGSDDALRLIPPRQMSIEAALEFISDDELLEITPKSVRIRKKDPVQHRTPEKGSRAAKSNPFYCNKGVLSMSVKEVLHTDLAPAAVGPYSQAVAANNMIFTSGQIPINPKTGKIEATTIEEQTEQVMQNLHCVLAEGGVASTASSRLPASSRI